MGMRGECGQWKAALDQWEMRAKQRGHSGPWWPLGHGSIATGVLVHSWGESVRTGVVVRSDLWKGGPRGCNRSLANPYSAVLRDADICWVDLTTSRRTRFHDARSGCTNGLIAAGGVLTAPNLAYHCGCNYAVCTSVAFVHVPREAGEHQDYCASGVVIARDPNTLSRRFTKSTSYRSYGHRLERVGNTSRCPCLRA